MTEIREIPFARPNITEDDRKAVLRVLDGHVLTHGPEGKAFEAEFAAFMGPDAHAVTVSSCMAALHLAYLHLGVGPGDEVIVPAQTHAAAAHAVEWVGARPVFVDCDPATGNVTVERIAPALTDRTKVISVVHYAGIPCAMPDIVTLAQERGLKVVEDCAISIGTRWDGRHVGLFGDIGCFSFYPVKHITTGEGGMFVSRHAAVTEAVARLRAFGVDRTHTERTVPGMYDVPTLGLNYRMSELQAALGRSQTQRLGTILRVRRAHFRALQKALAGIEDLRVIDTAEPAAESSFYCLTAVLQGSLAGKRNEAVARLNAAGVGTSVYYPQPVPRMTYYRKKYGEDPARYRNAAEISDQSIALPVGPHLGDDDIRYVAETVSAVMEGLRS